MTGKYDKTIVLEEEGEVKGVVIFNEKVHLPVFYGVDKFGMDDILELFGGVNTIPPQPATVSEALKNPPGR